MTRLALVTVSAWCYALVTVSAELREGVTMQPDSPFNAAVLDVPAECPTCHRHAWRYEGDVDERPTHVYCQSCSRRYRRMSATERAAFWLNMASIEIRRYPQDAFTYAYNQAVLSVLGVEGASGDSSYMVCTFNGTPDTDDYDDETPF